MTIAIIGAGVAGAACVSVLRSSGADFLVFEKSRGAGGRLTTRRVSGISDVNELSFDHGCPHFEWPQNIDPHTGSCLQSSTIQNFRDVFVACPTMPQLVKDLLGPTKINTQKEIEAIEGSSGEWFLRMKSSPSEGTLAERMGPFKQVVVTAPAPQAMKLLAGASCSWRSELQKISYTPCWSLMFAVKSDLVSLVSDTESIFESFIPQHLKPSRTVPSGISSFVAQASADWTHAHLELPAEEIIQLLLPQALRQFALESESVIYAAAHRWRFSQVVSSLGRLLMADDANGLYYAGDGCLGEGVAGSIRSGAAVGRLLLK